jgi:hypothetical protein
LEIAGIILLAVVIAVVLLKMRANPKKKAGLRVPKKKAHKVSAAGKRKIATADDFPSVSIRYGRSACPAVTALAEKRFLANEAPSVPLEDCNSANCTCKYVHHEIRREQGDDRRTPSSLQTSLYDNSGKPERRHGGRRRSSDAQ